jgi:hypothetical protein
MSVHLRRERRLCMLIYFDFLGESVGYFHAICLDLLAQNADDIALVVLPVLPFPGKFKRGSYLTLPSVPEKLIRHFARGLKPHIFVILTKRRNHYHEGCG